MVTRGPQTTSAGSWQAAGAIRRFEPALVWLGLMLYLSLAKLALDTWLPGAFADPAQAAVFAWPAIGLYLAAGLGGAWLADQSGFPRPWSGWAVSRGAILLPLLGGLAFGGSLVALDLATGFTQAVNARHGLEQQYTDPLSMFLIFTAGPAIVELIYRLLPLSLLQWLIAERLLKGRGREQVFWTLALVTSLQEPLGMLDDLLVSPWPLALVRMLHLFGLNLFQAAIFRHYGLLAAIAVRVAFYLIWHVSYIH